MSNQINHAPVRTDATVYDDQVEQLVTGTEDVKGTREEALRELCATYDERYASDQEALGLVEEEGQSSVLSRAEVTGRSMDRCVERYEI